MPYKYRACEIQPLAAGIRAIMYSVCVGCKTDVLPECRNSIASPAALTGRETGVQISTASDALKIVPPGIWLPFIPPDNLGSNNE